MAGEFDITVNYEDLQNPDNGPIIGTHINRDDYDRSFSKRLTERSKLVSFYVSSIPIVDPNTKR